MPHFGKRWLQVIASAPFGLIHMEVLRGASVFRRTPRARRTKLLCAVPHRLRQFRVRHRLRRITNEDGE